MGSNEYLKEPAIPERIRPSQARKANDEAKEG